MSGRAVHPVADLFPMLAADELAELADDIKVRGLLQPIVLDADGRVLDGRNRLAACEIAGAEPWFQTYDGDDPDGYALAVNIARRHLTTGARAIIAAKAARLNGQSIREVAAGTDLYHPRVAHMSEASARTSVERALTHLEAAAEEVVRQINGRAWLALGYESWDEMREAEYKGAAVIVPRADRPELVARLRQEGLSQQQIGNTLGVAKSTVQTDLDKADSDFTESPTVRVDSLGRSRPTTYAPRAQEAPPAFETAVERPADPASSVPSEAVTKFLDSDPDLQRERYLHAFVKALARSDDFMEFDPEKLGELADPDIVRSIDDYGINVQNFVDRFRRARRGLQMLQGGVT